MTIQEKIANKKKELAEKRAELKKRIKESRAAVAGDDSSLSADDIQKIQKQITIIENDCKQCAADLDALEQISPLLQDPDEPDNTDSDMDNAQTDSADPTDSTAQTSTNGQAPAHNKAAGVIPAGKQSNSRIITAEERGIILPMHNVKNAERRSLGHVRSFESYVRSKGERRDVGLAFDASYGAIVPTEYLNATDQPLPPNSLAPLVNKVAVKEPHGFAPIFKRQTLGMTVVSPLQPNAVTANPAIYPVEYQVQTYRQQLNVSQEMIDDTNVDITGKIADYINEQKYLTEQYAIGHLMVAGDDTTVVTPVAISVSKGTAGYQLDLVDQIKEQFNVKLNIAYTNRVFVATQSAFQILDTLRDNYGRYLVQQSITDASSKTMFGVPLVIVQDVAMGAQGEAHLWLGDPKMFCLYAHKADTTARWFAGYNYELQLYAFYRADFRVADPDAGISMTLAITV
ncbi:phage major capsid protein [Sporolactobacillus putidus]|uniref:Phage capsid protein n=1 Tax=Sporolactobacillus putidus TaxID=492735 RepID=A0A917W2Y6_9BACL|nr:phage major capsid protein [Sporolactobacillus putidus]GGL55871.1 phage capsid protein [Sporolactobacillus putidus]